MSEVKTQIAQSPGADTLFFNPFPGLRPFDMDESHLFFGREGQSDDVLAKLAQNRFVAVIGASGSGKSSLMYCGVIPTLYGGFITDAGESWKVIAARPGYAPIDNLAEALVKADLEGQELGAEEEEIRRAITATVIRSSSQGLIEAVRQYRRNHSENVLILIDQFEELFRYKRSRGDSTAVNESAAFVKLLLQAARQSELPIYVVLTMRSDFIGDCAQFPALTKLINDSHYLIPQMTRENLRDAINGPVAVGGGEISTRLVQTLLNEVGDNNDQLPILQHSLMRTWDYWSNNRETGEPMDIAHYEAIGRMEKALSEHASEAYEELTEGQKQVCEVLFKALTEKAGDNRGIRRPTSVADVAAIARCTEQEVMDVVEVFRKPGRSLLTPSHEVPLKSESMLDISHESLMRIWDRLKSWVEDESQSVQMYQRLSEAAALYQVGKTGLWRPPDLQLALNWREKQKPTLTWAQRYHPAFERAMVFLDTSARAYETEEQNKIMLQKRALRRSRIVAIILGTAAVISLLFMVYAFILRTEAKKQEQLAQEQKAEAETQRELAKEEQRKAIEEKRKADLARLEAERQKERAEEALKQAELAELEARRQAEIAREQAEIARQNEKKAELARKEAERQTQLAKEASDAAFRLRMLSIAQSMAVKSQQITRDTSEKALVAFQAYQFNEQYGGDDLHPDIYDGLYYTLKLLNEEEYNALRGHRDAVRDVSFCGSTNAMFSAGSDGRILRWTNAVAGGKENETVYQGSAINRGMTVSPDGHTLAVGRQDGGILLFDANSPGSPPDLVGVQQGVVSNLSFRPDGKLLTSGSQGNIYLWDVKAHSNQVFAQTESKVLALAAGPDNQLAAAGTANGKLIVWWGGTAKVFASDANSPTHSVAFSPDGQWLASGDLQGTIRIWDVKTGKVIIVLGGHGARVHDLEFSPNGKLLASASFDGTVQVFQTGNYNKSPLVLRDHDTWVWSVAFSPESDKLYAACVDNLIRVWPTDPDQMAQNLCDRIDRNMAFSEWQRYVAEDIAYRKTCNELPYGEGAKPTK